MNKPNSSRTPHSYGANARPQPAQSEREKGLQELLHRLHTRVFAPEHVKEAAVVVAQIQTKADSVRLAKRFITSPIVQVRDFAEQLLRVVETPEKSVAQDAEAPAHMGYAAIAEVVKQWIHEEAGRQAHKPSTRPKR
jgi:hypothetical protein